MGLNQFWKGRRVFVTGHTGFKGAWLCLWLERLGASVRAIALPPEPSASLYNSVAPWPDTDHKILDIRDAAALADDVRTFQPEIVLHLAAQALVRQSYADPVETFSTNILGTVNLLEVVRDVPSVRTVLVVTSDKVYANAGQGRPFVEDDPLGGTDPYSSSKACAELICASYRKSYFQSAGVALATARAGNVIGGGDWAKDRLVPDFIRALAAGKPVELRYPDAVRPWQHVLEPLGGYLRYAQALTEQGGDALPAALNIGPDPRDFARVAELAEELGAAFGIDESWRQAPGEWEVEASLLTLDSTLAAETLGWRPRLARAQAMDWTAAWYRAEREGADMRRFTLDQIAAYEDLGR
jgi:CDP-glucose 4,6-dehydratase